jgi:hypothetical protein
MCGVRSTHFTKSYFPIAKYQDYIFAGFLTEGLNLREATAGAKS